MNADPSRPTEATRGHFRAELNHLCDRFESADRRAKTSTATVDREAAEVERRQASADFWAAVG